MFAGATGTTLLGLINLVAFLKRLVASENLFRRPLSRACRKLGSAMPLVGTETSLPRSTSEMPRSRTASSTALLI